MPASANERPGCGNCEWWTAPKAVPAGSPSREALGLSAQGECTRFPRATLKRPQDVCGEHPTFVGQRNSLLATMIAGVIAPQGRRG